MAHQRYPETKILASEQAAWASWCAHIAGVDPDAARPDGWTLKDVVTHVAAWQRYSSRRLAAIGRGEPDPGPPDTDAFNEQARSASTSRSWDEVRTEADDAHEAFLRTIASMPPGTLDADDGLGAFVVAVNGVEHYEEHLSDVFR